MVSTLPATESLVRCCSETSSLYRVQPTRTKRSPSSGVRGRGYQELSDVDHLWQALRRRPDDAGSCCHHEIHSAEFDRTVGVRKRISKVESPALESPKVENLDWTYALRGKVGSSNLSFRLLDFPTQDFPLSKSQS